MTLYTTDYLEYYLTLVGWLIHNGIWNLLLASGLFALPFLLIVVQEWLHARTVSGDESQQSLLSTRRIESRMLLAIGVIAFGQHTWTNDIGLGMTTSSLGSTCGQTTSSVAWHYCPWAGHTVRRCRPWHAIIALGQHTTS